VTINGRWIVNALKYSKAAQLATKIYNSRYEWGRWVFLFALVIVYKLTRDHTLFTGFPVVVLWSNEHNYITKAALDVLPEPEKEFLEPERDLLWKIYCEFPDLNWAYYGSFGGEYGAPDIPRVNDIRREWDISYYCGFDPVTGHVPEQIPGMITTAPSAPPYFKKAMYSEDLGYCPMGDYGTPARYFPKIIDSWRNGLLGDGMRFLGVLLHHVEDRGAFAYWPSLHIKGHVPDPEECIRLDSYDPQILGKTVDKAVSGIEERMRSLLRFTEGRVPAVDAAWKSGDAPGAEALILENALENVRAVADIIHTAVLLVDRNLSVPYWSDYRALPAMVNLLQNPGAEISDGTDMPAGWVASYDNLEDRVGRAEWVHSRLHSFWFTVVRSGGHSLKLMWTPPEGIEWRQRWTCAIPAQPGQRFDYSGWLKTAKATGASYLVLYFYTKDNQLVSKAKGVELDGDSEWQRVSLTAVVPEGTAKLIAACRSDNNRGAVWFDDLELIRLAD
jgi:hypothetical protein